MVLREWLSMVPMRTEIAVNSAEEHNAAMVLVCESSRARTVPSEGYYWLVRRTVRILQHTNMQSCLSVRSISDRTTCTTYQVPIQYMLKSRSIRRWNKMLQCESSRASMVWCLPVCESGLRTYSVRRRSNGALREQPRLSESGLAGLLNCFRQRGITC